MSTIRGTDLFLINQDDKSYKITAGRLAGKGTYATTDKIIVAPQTKADTELTLTLEDDTSLELMLPGENITAVDASVADPFAKAPPKKYAPLTTAITAFSLDDQMVIKEGNNAQNWNECTPRTITTPGTQNQNISNIFWFDTHALYGGTFTATYVSGNNFYVQGTNDPNLDVAAGAYFPVIAANYDPVVIDSDSPYRYVRIYAGGEDATIIFNYEFTALHRLTFEDAQDLIYFYKGQKVGIEGDESVAKVTDLCTTIVNTGNDDEVLLTFASDLNLANFSVNQNVIANEGFDQTRFWSEFYKDNYGPITPEYPDGQSTLNDEKMAFDGNIYTRPTAAVGITDQPGSISYAFIPDQDVELSPSTIGFIYRAPNQAPYYTNYGGLYVDYRDGTTDYLIGETSTGAQTNYVSLPQDASQENPVSDPENYVMTVNADNTKIIQQIYFKNASTTADVSDSWCALYLDGRILTDPGSDVNPRGKVVSVDVDNNQMTINPDDDTPDPWDQGVVGDTVSSVLNALPPSATVSDVDVENNMMFVTPATPFAQLGDKITASAVAGQGTVSFTGEDSITYVQTSVATPFVSSGPWTVTELTREDPINYVTREEGSQYNINYSTQLRCETGDFTSPNFAGYAFNGDDSNYAMNGTPGDVIYWDTSKMELYGSVRVRAFVDSGTCTVYVNNVAAGTISSVQPTFVTLPHTGLIEEVKFVPDSKVGMFEFQIDGQQLIDYQYAEDVLIDNISSIQEIYTTTTTDFSQMKVGDSAVMLDANSDVAYYTPKSSDIIDIEEGGVTSVNSTIAWNGYAQTVWDEIQDWNSLTASSGVGAENGSKGTGGSQVISTPFTFTTNDFGITDNKGSNGWAIMFDQPVTLEFAVNSSLITEVISCKDLSESVAEGHRYTSFPASAHGRVFWFNCINYPDIANLGDLNNGGTILTLQNNVDLKYFVSPDVVQGNTAPNTVINVYDSSGNKLNSDQYVLDGGATIGATSDQEIVERIFFSGKDNGAMAAYTATADLSDRSAPPNFADLLTYEFEFEYPITVDDIVNNQIYAIIAQPCNLYVDDVLVGSSATSSTAQINMINNLPFSKIKVVPQPGEYSISMNATGIYGLRQLDLAVYYNLSDGDAIVLNSEPEYNQLTVSGGEWSIDDTVTGPPITGTGIITEIDAPNKQISLLQSNGRWVESGAWDSTFVVPGAQANWNQSEKWSDYLSTNLTFRSPETGGPKYYKEKAFNGSNLWYQQAGIVPSSGLDDDAAYIRFTLPNSIKGNTVTSLAVYSQNVLANIVIELNVDSGGTAEKTYTNLSAGSEYKSDVHSYRFNLTDTPTTIFNIQVRQLNSNDGPTLTGIEFNGQLLVDKGVKSGGEIVGKGNAAGTTFNVGQVKSKVYKGNGRSEDFAIQNQTVVDTVPTGTTVYAGTPKIKTVTSQPEPSNVYSSFLESGSGVTINSPTAAFDGDAVGTEAITNTVGPAGYLKWKYELIAQESLEFYIGGSPMDQNITINDTAAYISNDDTPKNQWVSVTEFYNNDGVTHADTFPGFPFLFESIDIVPQGDNRSGRLGGVRVDGVVLVDGQSMNNHEDVITFDGEFEFHQYFAPGNAVTQTVDANGLTSSLKATKSYVPLSSAVTAVQQNTLTLTNNQDLSLFKIGDVFQATGDSSKTGTVVSVGDKSITYTPGTGSFDGYTGTVELTTAIQGQGNVVSATPTTLTVNVTQEGFVPSGAYGEINTQTRINQVYPLSDNLTAIKSGDPMPLGYFSTGAVSMVDDGTTTVASYSPLTTTITNITTDSGTGAKTLTLTNNQDLKYFQPGDVVADPYDFDINADEDWKNYWTAYPSGVPTFAGAKFGPEKAFNGIYAPDGDGIIPWVSTETSEYTAPTNNDSIIWTPPFPITVKDKVELKLLFDDPTVTSCVINAGSPTGETVVIDSSTTTLPTQETLTYTATAADIGGELRNIQLISASDRWYVYLGGVIVDDKVLISDSTDGLDTVISVNPSANQMIVSGGPYGLFNASQTWSSLQSGTTPTADYELTKAFDGNLKTQGGVVSGGNWNWTWTASFDVPNGSTLHGKINTGAADRNLQIDIDVDGVTTTIKGMSPGIGIVEEYDLYTNTTGSTVTLSNLKFTNQGTSSQTGVATIYWIAVDSVVFVDAVPSGGEGDIQSTVTGSARSGRGFAGPYSPATESILVTNSNNRWIESGEWSSVSQTGNGRGSNFDILAEPGTVVIGNGRGEDFYIQDITPGTANLPPGTLLVERAGVSYRISSLTLDTKLDNTDLLLINRAGTSYKVDGATLKSYINTKLAHTNGNVLNFTKGAPVPFHRYGYYPLYATQAQAQTASGQNTSESLTLGGKTYYMPTGAGVLNTRVTTPPHSITDKMIQDTDEFLIHNGGQAYKVTALRLSGTGAAVSGDLIINRLAFPTLTVETYKIAYADLDTKLDNSDFLMVSRGNQAYAVLGSDYKLYANTTRIDAGQSLINFTKGDPVAFAHDGYYPLYATPSEANSFSPVRQNRAYSLANGTFYMPQGITKSMMFIDDFTGITNNI